MAWRIARISFTDTRNARLEEKRKIDTKKSPYPSNSQEETASVSEASVFTPQPSLTCANGIDKFQFNYKEFDVDTSCPFDNMELKTINDMEALAQVIIICSFYLLKKKIY